jgi:hypothetical protein
MAFFALDRDASMMQRAKMKMPMQISLRGTYTISAQA